MDKIILKVTNNRDRIKAPEHCPYRILSDYATGNVWDVSVTLCPICKLCNFMPDVDISNQTNSITQQDRDSISLYFTQKNKKVANAMLAQFQYLVKEEKTPLLMIIQWKLLQEALDNVIQDFEKRKCVEQYFLLNDAIICYCMGCPVYVSKKLSKTLLQVVGEIQWRI